MFITPRIPFIKYHNSVIHNNPVNLSLCTNIEKSKLAWYPDNYGKPAITFHFNSESDVQWVYNTEEDRDMDFAGISSNNYKG